MTRGSLPIEYHGEVRKQYEIRWIGQLFPGKKGAEVFEDGNQIGKIKKKIFRG